jgi:hypothetical protein
MNEQCPPIAVIQGLPEIGKLYRVPCVRMESGTWQPVISKRAHTDIEALKVYWHHYHYDFRFISDFVLRSITYTKEGETG